MESMINQKENQNGTKYTFRQCELFKPQMDLKNESIENEKMNFYENSDDKAIAILNSKFYLIKLLGKGATGSVYLSYSFKEKSKEKTFYAIKIIQQKDPNGNYINSCEVDFLEKMNHKNILKIYGHGLGILETSLGQKQQAYYIIMDYLNHGSLLSQINGNIGFGEEIGRLIFAQLLDGLEAIHNSDIVHRDIKLDNIMLSGNDYTLKYVDFGFATQKSNGYLTTFLGTPNYAAPELHFKKPYLGEYEDIFSLGVALFIIVTGHLPFILPTPNDPLYKYIFCVDYVSYWRKRNIKVSHSFMELFDNLIAFDPSQRPSISEIKNSKWMKEINWSLLPNLRQEYINRENKRNNPLIEKQNMIKDINNNYDKDNKEKNTEQILLKIKEEKLEVINNIKKKLFYMNKEQEKTHNEKKLISKENIIEVDNNINCNYNKQNELQGFIKIKMLFKNLNSLINLLRQFLKIEGYNMTKKNIDNLTIELSNGEIDVRLLFEKEFKEIKISFIIINGNKEDFTNFKKIMKKFNIKQY